MISRLNDILFCFYLFSVFLVLISFLAFLFQFSFHHISLKDIKYRLNDIISRLNEIFVVLISILIFLFQFSF